MTKKIAVYHYKGGVGKSTVATNLAAGLAMANFKVALFTTDGQNNNISFLSVEPFDNKPTFYDLVKDNPLTLSEVAIPLMQNLDGFPSAKQEVVNVILTAMNRIDLAFSEILPEEQTEKYDYIIFDMGPGENRLNTATLYYVDAVIMPVQTETPSIEAISNLYDYFSNLRLSRSLIKFVIPNLYDKRKISNRACLRYLQETFPPEMLLSVIPDYTDYGNASGTGVPIFDFEPKLAEPFMNLVERVVREI